MWPDLWVKVSGDVVKDAAYLLSLRGVAGGYAARQRELKRLAVLYGAGCTTRWGSTGGVGNGPGLYMKMRKALNAAMTFTSRISSDKPGNHAKPD